MGEATELNSGAESTTSMPIRRNNHRHRISRQHTPLRAPASGSHGREARGRDYDAAPPPPAGQAPMRIETEWLGRGRFRRRRVVISRGSSAGRFVLSAELDRGA